MLLSNLIEKTILVSSAPHGICMGVGVSLKNFTVKYLLCASSQSRKQADFCVNFSALDDAGESITLKTLRPVFPRSCARFSPHLPIFSADGSFVGRLSDLEILDDVAIRFFTEDGRIFPLSSVLACTDAVILKKEQPFPIGQRIPAPVISTICNKKEGLVTKPLLRIAKEKSCLIKLTLSLAPFNVQLFTS